jgi:MoxR-like ATPase
MPYRAFPLFDEPHNMIESMLREIGQVIVGKRDAVEKVLVAMLCGGHVLLEDVPGVGKTLLVKTLARTVDCSFQRIQFTPDLMPADVTGVSIYNPRTRDFEFRPGAVMANIVLADELNRTSPKTQSALLEVMEEKCVTVDGSTYPMPQPFFILATQNPLAYEGTYPLPEAQLDRFLLNVRLGYPEKQEELEILNRFQEDQPLERVRPVILREEWRELQKQVSSVFIEPSLKEYIVDLAQATRRHKDLQMGISPRGTLALLKAAQAHAMIQGRAFILPDDIKTMMEPVWGHRLALTPEGKMAGADPFLILRGIAESVPVPVLKYTRISG